MKKYIYLMIALVLFGACEQYDDSKIWETLQDHEERIQKLETLCGQMNANIASMGAVLDALAANDYVTGVSKVVEDGVDVGYTINFSKSGAVTIYHCKDGAAGADGHTPKVGMLKDDNGEYCWTLDGEWMTDGAGAKVPVCGKDGEDGKNGVTPELKIEGDYWHVSYDGGASWEKLQKAVAEDGKDGVSFFKDVDFSDPDCFVLTLSDGQKISLPTWKAFEQLKSLVDGLNMGVASLQTIVDALQANDYVTSVVPIMEDGKTVGYTLNFSQSGAVNIYHGRDGKDGVDGEDGADGYTPAISVARGDDGRYYWTLDGQWMTDGEGNMIPSSALDGADGKDGVLPKVKIENSLWYVSYDGGVTWEKEPLGSAVGSLDEGFFSDFRYDLDYLYLTLTDGEQIRLPRHDNDISSVLGDLAGPAFDNGKVTFTGRLLVAAENLPFCKVTLYYSASTSFNVFTAQSAATADFASDGGFVLSASGLKVGSKYTYCLCVQVKSKKVYMPVSEVVVPHVYDQPKDYDAASANDLSAVGTANCYIVSQSGLYKFKAVKGNTTAALQGVASVSIVWESFGTATAPEFFDLIEGVCYKNGYVVMKTADEFKEGNALVAAKDASGKVLWSWHIWLTDKPAEQVYFNGAGTMMDRNIGALCATPGDVGAMGLMYQWGRKDPFMASSSISTAKYAKSTITWPSAVSSDSVVGTLEYASEHPTTFILYDRQNFDWYFTDSPAVDTTRWAVSEAPKSVNDPCPYGWRIPDGSSAGVWGTALGVKNYGTYSFDTTNKGMQMGGILGADENIWYPAAGNIDHVDGSIIRTGTAGIVWSATYYKAGSYYTNVSYWTTNNRFYVHDYGTRARAYSARCVKE